MTQRAIDGEYIYFVTTNVQDRRWFFVTPEKATQLGQTIRTCCRMKKFELLAYCILPNHIHLLVRKLPADEGLRGAPAAQRTLGSVRCETEDDAFLFSHRRLPSRRSLEKRPTLSHLMHLIKSAFSQHLHHGKFWQHRSNFRIIETEEYLSNVVEYIQYNYQKMDLPEHYGEAPFVFVNQAAIDRAFGFSLS